jgi:hypothetical protein
VHRSCAGCQQPQHPAAVRGSLRVPDEGDDVALVALVQLWTGFSCRSFTGCLQGEYVAIQSVSCGKLLQARRKHPPLVVYSTMAGVWEQWHVSTELSQQGHAIAHRFTNRQ